MLSPELEIVARISAVKEDVSAAAQIYFVSALFYAPMHLSAGMG